MARILLADDDAAARDLVRRALEADGHSVVATQDGAEALEHIGGNGAFDLLVTDVNMPGVDGLTLAERAVAKHPSMAVLLISGHAEQLERAHTIAARRVGTLLKPFSLEQARAAVRSVAI